MNTTAAYPGTQAVLRAVELLKAFSTEVPERTLTELATAVSLNRTTAYRLLTALQSEGMVERSGPSYRLGPEMMALGAQAAGSSRLRVASQAELAGLSEATDETVTVEVLVGRDVLILDEVIGRHLIGTVPSLGTRWPAHSTSTGKVLLAHAPAELVERFLDQPLMRLTTKTITDPAAFRRELTRVRERGFGVTQEEVEAGFVAVSVPIWGPSESVVAALSVGGPKGRFPADRIATLAAQLRGPAGRIASRLGFRAKVART